MGNVFGQINEETPKHQVLPLPEGASGFYEIRKYPAMVAVQTSSSGDDKIDSETFMRLARYIGVFGKPENVKPGSEGVEGSKVAMTAPVVMQGTQKVAMTAPVVMTGNNRADMTMQFILPSEFTMETAPKPTDPKVSLCQIPEKVVAVHTFSGWANLKTMEKEKQNQLLEALKKDGVQVVASPYFMGYNPPWTLGPWRKNEIAVEVKL